MEYINHWRVEAIIRESRKLGYIQPEKLELCPSCENEALGYHPIKKVPYCLNCAWLEEVEPAPDVPLSFLELCLRDAKSDRVKSLIEKIIDVTRILYQNCPY